MPPKTSVKSKNDSDLILDSHERRIQRLEGDLGPLAQSVARLDEKMDGVTIGIGEVKDAINEHARASTQSATELMQRINKVEKDATLDKVKTATRWDLLKKAFWPLALIATAAATKFGEALYGQLFGAQ